MERLARLDVQHHARRQPDGSLLHLLLWPHAACLGSPAAPANTLGFSCGAATANQGSCSTTCAPNFILTSGSLNAICVSGAWSSVSGVCSPVATCECMVCVCPWLQVVVEQSCMHTWQLPGYVLHAGADTPLAAALLHSNSMHRQPHVCAPQCGAVQLLRNGQRRRMLQPLCIWLQLVKRQLDSHLQRWHVVGSDGTVHAAAQWCVDCCHVQTAAMAGVMCTARATVGG